MSKNQSLIDHAPLGISLEVGPHQRTNNATDIINAIESLLNSKEQTQTTKCLEVFDTLKEDGELTVTNFEKVLKNQIIGKKNNGTPIRAPCDFYPVLVGEQAYKEILCLMAKYTQIL